MASASQPLDSPLAETLPLIQSERKWSLLDVTAVKSGLAIATWSFVVGGATAQLVGFVDAVIAMLLGTAIGVTVVIFALILPSSKWGTECFVHHRSVFGPLGSALLVTMLVVIAVPFWTGILAQMTGGAVVQVANATIPGGLSSPAAIETGFALALVVASWFAIVRGSKAVRVLNLVAAPCLILLCLWLLVALLSEVSLSQLVAAKPSAPIGSNRNSFMLAVELNIANGFSWFGLAANLGRFAKTQRAAVWGSFIGYVPVSVFASIVGLMSALVLSSADPVTWMIPIAGTVAGAILLGFLVLANASSLVGMIQGNCTALIQHLGPRMQALGWGGASMAILAGGVLVILFASEALLDKFFTIVAFVQAVFAATAGVILADRVVLRRSAVSLAQLYRNDSAADYRFWRGINPFAFVAMACGAGVYLLLMNPLTFDTAPLFVLTSASLPAVAVAMAMHILLTRLIVIPAGKGAYSAIQKHDVPPSVAGD